MAIYFAPTVPCGKGVYPSIAASNKGLVVEVHATPGSSTELWYRVGQENKRAGKIAWGTSQSYGNGHYPSVAINSSDFVVEVDERGLTLGTRTLYYRVGKVDGDRKIIRWGESHRYEGGRCPVVALRDDGVIITAHYSSSWSGSSDSCKLYYRVGELDTAKKAIEWRSETHLIGKLGAGYYPSIAINNDGTVVEMDNCGKAGTLQYRVGHLTAGCIEWGTQCHSFEGEAGCFPSVAINNNNVVVEAHQLKSGVHARIGEVNPQAKCIQWEDMYSYKYSDGSNPAIALTDDNWFFMEYGLSSHLMYNLGQMHHS